MKIDDLIAALQRVKESEGNIDVVAAGFTGTNQGFVAFDIKPLPKDFVVADHLSSLGLSLSIEVSEQSKADIRKGIRDMERLGHTFYRSQFVEAGEKPKPGLSPCEWHNVW